MHRRRAVPIFLYDQETKLEELPSAATGGEKRTGSNQGNQKEGIKT